MFQLASPSWLNLDWIWSLVRIFKRGAPVKATTPHSIPSHKLATSCLYAWSARWMAFCQELPVDDARIKETFLREQFQKSVWGGTGLNVGLWHFFDFVHLYWGNAGDICKHLNWRGEQRKEKREESSEFMAFEPKSSLCCSCIVPRHHQLFLCWVGSARSRNIVLHWSGFPDRTADPVRIHPRLHLVLPNTNLGRRQILIKKRVPCRSKRNNTWERA